jgi:hypothetical protein
MRTYGAVILEGRSGDIVPSAGEYALQVVCGTAVIENSSGGATALLEPLASKPMNVLAPGDYIDFNEASVTSNGLPAAGDKRLGISNGEQLGILTENAGRFGPIIGGNDGGLFITNFQADSFAGAARFAFHRSNGTPASPTKIVSGNEIVGLYLGGQTGGGPDILKQFMEVAATGDWDTTTDEPFCIKFNTIPDGSGTAVNRLVIDSDGSIYAGATTDQTLDRLKSNIQTNTTYTLVRADMGKMVDQSNAAAITTTIPLNSSVAFPIGTVINIFQAGAGQITVVGAGGVTLRAPGGAKTRVQYSVISLWKRNTDEWVLSGDSTT